MGLVLIIRQSVLSFRVCAPILEICSLWEHGLLCIGIQYILGWTMRDKNEGIYLWLLEKDRQKNRALVYEETVHNSTLQSSGTPQDALFNGEKFKQHEDKPSIQTETADLEQLLKELACLEEELRQLSDEQKQLSMRVKVMCEKLVQEIKKKDGQKQQEVNQLQKRIGKLETHLGETSHSDESGESEDRKIDSKPYKLDQDGVTVDIIEEIK